MPLYIIYVHYARDVSKNKRSQSLSIKQWHSDKWYIKQPKNWEKTKVKKIPELNLQSSKI